MFLAFFHKAIFRLQFIKVFIQLTMSQKTRDLAYMITVIYRDVNI